MPPNNPRCCIKNPLTHNAPFCIFNSPQSEFLSNLSNERHSFFERHEDDILCQVPISFVQAALGEEIDIPTLNGTKRITIPPGTQSGQVFTLRGIGILHLDGYGKGDQHVQVTVKVPAKLNKRQKELLKEFASLEGKEDY